MPFTPSPGVRRLLTMLVESPTPVAQLDCIGLSKELDRALIQNYADIVDGVASITAAGRAALSKPHMTPKKVSNLLTAAKAALDYIKVVDAPKPVGLVAALAAAIADLETQ